MNLSGAILKLFGWKSVYKVTELPKSVICVAPHTSNWDFIIGKLFYWSLNKKAGFLMKKSWFFFPMGLLFKAMGGVPIDRSKRMSVTQQMVLEFEKRPRFHLAITPEGTRKPNPEWKKGFYYIAHKANVPIVLAYLDYKKKEAGVKAVFYPTGNTEEDIETIRSYYRGVQGRNAENFAEN